MIRQRGAVDPQDRCNLVVILREARIGAELTAAQERGELVTRENHGRGDQQGHVRASDETPTLSEIGIPRQRAAESRYLRTPLRLGAVAGGLDVRAGSFSADLEDSVMHIPNPRRDKFDTAAEVFGGGLILIGVFGAMLIPMGQAFYWLRHGVWVALDLATILAAIDIQFLPTKWVGLNQIGEWIGGVPLALVVLASGFSIGWLVAGSADPRTVPAPRDALQRPASSGH